MTASKLKMTSAPSEQREAELRTHEWFIAYSDTTTRDALAQGLQLVDHGGDEIHYSGDTLHGFKVTFDQMIYLVKSRKAGVYNFKAYHKATGSDTWHLYMENKRSGKQTLRNHARSGAVSKAG